MTRRYISRSSSAAARRFARIILLLVLLPLLLTTTALAADDGNVPTVKPPSEKILCQYGLWGSEYWADDGILGFNYIGDPYPTVETEYKMNKAVDFNVSAPTLLTAIVDVHVKVPLISTGDDGGVEAMPSPGTLALVDGAGNIYGPYAVEPVVSTKEAVTEFWIASVDHAELKPGYYRVVDSDVSSLLCNGQAHDVCATFVKGVDASAYAKYMDALDTAAQGVTTVTYSTPDIIVNSAPDNNYSGGSVKPVIPAVFTAKEPLMITKIQDYHLGQSGAPGLISIREAGGKVYGPWQAYGQAYNGTPNAVWTVTPDIDIPSGAYTVIDSDPASQSADAGGKAMCTVKAAPSVTTLTNNVSGQYIFSIIQDDAAPFTVSVSVIDQTKNILLAFTVVDFGHVELPFKVTERKSGKVTAEIISPRVGEWGVTCRLTFAKNGDKFDVTGPLTVIGGSDSVDAPLTARQISSTVPGYVPAPASGVGKLGSIPGPSNKVQAVTGVVVPALAVMAGAGIAGAFGGFGGGGDDGGGGYDDDSGGGYDDSGGGYDDSGGGYDDSGGGYSDDSGGYDDDSSYSDDSGGYDDDTAYDNSGSNDGRGEAGGGTDNLSGSTGGVDIDDDDEDIAGEDVGAGTGETTLTDNAPPQPDLPLDGQTKTVHDYGDGQDKTYFYNADSGQWINPLTGSIFVASMYADSLQTAYETATDTAARQRADAAAAAEGPTKSLKQLQDDNNARIRLLDRIHGTTQAALSIEGADGEGPVRAVDRLDKLAAGLVDKSMSVDEVTAALDRQQTFVQKNLTGKYITQDKAADIAKADTIGAAATSAVKDAVTQTFLDGVEGKSAAGLLVRGGLDVLTLGGAEAAYMGTAIAIKANESMQHGDGAAWAVTKAYVGEAGTVLAMGAAVHCGGAAIKGAASGLGIRPSVIVTLPSSISDPLNKFANALTSDVRTLLPGTGAKSAAKGATAEAAQTLAQGNAEFRAINQDLNNRVATLKEAAGNGPLTTDDIKGILNNTQAKRTLNNTPGDALKKSYNETLQNNIYDPANVHSQQALVEKYGTITDPSAPGYNMKKLLDDGYELRVTSVRTPKQGVNLSVNADNDVTAYMVKSEIGADGVAKVTRVELPAHDVSVAHSEGFGKSCGVYETETRAFDASKAGKELGIDFNNPKALTDGMSKDELAKFGVSKDLSNISPEKMTQLQLNKYAKAYGQDVPGAKGLEGATDFSRTNTTIMRNNELVQTPLQSGKLMAETGEGAMIDPEQLGLMERNKIETNWTAGTTESKMEALEGVRKLGELNDTLAKAYEGQGMQPLPADLKLAVQIASDRALSPDIRALMIQDLKVGDIPTLADKLRRFEGVKSFDPGN